MGSARDGTDGIDEEAARLRELVEAYHAERGLGDADEVLDVSLDLGGY